MRDYFWLTQDMRWETYDAIVPDNIVSARQKISGDISHLGRVTLIHSRFSVNEESQFDVIDRGVFMVSKPVKELFDLVLPYTDYRQICIAYGKGQRPACVSAPAMHHLPGSAIT